MYGLLGNIERISSEWETLTVWKHDETSRAMLPAMVQSLHVSTFWIAACNVAGSVAEVPWSST
jgi:hypothetical protein